MLLALLAQNYSSLLFFGFVHLLSLCITFAALLFACSLLQIDIITLALALVVCSRCCSLFVVRFNIVLICCSCSGYWCRNCCCYLLHSSKAVAFIAVCLCYCCCCWLLLLVIVIIIVVSIVVVVVVVEYCRSCTTFLLSVVWATFFSLCLFNSKAFPPTV